MESPPHCRHLTVAVTISLAVFSSIAPAGAQGRRPADAPRAGLREVLRVDLDDARQDLVATTRAMTARYVRNAATLLEDQMRILDGYCRLTARQQRRLELAARGVVKRNTERFREELEDIAQLPDHQTAINRLKALHAEVKLAVSAPETDQLWRRAVDTTLSEHQRGELRKNEDARNAFRRQLWVHNAVAEIDDRTQLLYTQRNELMRRITAWAAANPLPPPNRARRSAWQWLPEDDVLTLVLPALDPPRRAQVIAAAPIEIRRRLEDAADQPDTPPVTRKPSNADKKTP